MPRNEDMNERIRRAARGEGRPRVQEPDPLDLLPPHLRPSPDAGEHTKPEPRTASETMNTLLREARGKPVPYSELRRGL